MDSDYSTVKVLSDLEQKDELEVHIEHLRKDAIDVYDQPSSDFSVTFENRRSAYSSEEVIVLVSIISKLEHGKFNAVARLEYSDGTVYHEDKKSSVFHSCILVLCTDNCGTVNLKVKISKIGSSPKTESATFGTFENTTCTDKVYVRQKKLANDLYNSREATGDVTIATTSGAEHKAHKLILGTQSPFFKTLFEVDLKERQESKVKIDKFEEDVVIGIIEFMYVGWTDSVGTNPEALLAIAHMYQVKDLVEACWDSLMKTLTINSAVGLFRLSGKFDDDGSYKKEVGRFLLKNFAVIRKTAEFTAMVKEDADLFAEICGLDF